MDTLSLNQDKDLLCRELVELLDGLSERLDAYLDIFDIKDLYSFEANKEKRELYKGEYAILSKSIAIFIQSVSALSYRLTCLIAMADEAMCDELSIKLGEIFEDYKRLSSELLAFTNESSAELESESLGSGALLDSARRLKLFTVTMKEKLT